MTAGLRAFRELRVGTALWSTRAYLWSQAKLGDPAAQLLTRGTTPPYALYDRIREQGPLVTSRLGPRISASHRIVSHLLRDHRLGVVQPGRRARGVLEPPEPLPEWIAHPIVDSLLSLDPPAHTRLRRLVSPWFTPRAINQRSEQIRAIVDHFLDELDTSRPVDLVREFAVRVPIRVISDLLGVPDPDYPQFARWGWILGTALDGARTLKELNAVRTTLVQLDRFFRDLIERRRHEPGDDVISGLVHNAGGEEPVTSRELLATAQLLLLAGFETTVNMIGSGVLALLDHPTQRDLLVAEPERAANAAEEVLRYASPVQFTVRVVHREVEVEGIRLHPGEQVLLLLGGANRDPQVFPDPAQFDITRENAREHLAFSAGAHYCLGAGLARLEGTVALGALFRRFPRLELAGTPRYRSSRLIHGIQHLPVLLEGRRARVAS
ncbi:MAG TPA: cytochrome P450 [Pseudonocardiaceae bacterium]